MVDYQLHTFSDQSNSLGGLLKGHCHGDFVTAQIFGKEPELLLLHREENINVFLYGITSHNQFLAQEEEQKRRTKGKTEIHRKNLKK